MAVIAIAGYPTKAWADPRVVTAVERYVSAVRRAGGHEAILVPQPLDRVSANQILARFDGLLLMGGGDVDPALYQQERQPETHNISADRDSFEIALIQSAVEREMPLLAICRGIQVLNVAFGGTLVQHFDRTEVHHGQVTVGQHSSHQVEIDSSSKLHDALGVEHANCSSHHHQALEKVAEDLIPVAWSPDGVVEGVELSGGWVIGVQWHPEVTALEDPVQQNLFDALVKQASGDR